MLSSFVTGKTTSPMIIIEDAFNHQGINLFQSLVHNASNRQLQVHLLCFENPIDKWNHILNDNVHIYDFFSDHRGWNDGNQKNDFQHIYREKGLFKVVQELVSPGVPSVVFIDSLVPILFQHGLEKCYRDLHSLLLRSKEQEENLRQIVAVIHEDAIPDKLRTITQLRHLTTTFFQILRVVASDPSSWNSLHLTHRKAGGKIINQVEDYRINEDGSVISKEKSQRKRAKEEEDPSATMENLTTFKLTLNPQEEAARSQLVLPYTKQIPSDDQPGSGGRSSGSGKVIYEPDAADDWDDEDPDDDLDV